MSTQREPGYYWVRAIGQGWTVAYYSGNCFYLTGTKETVFKNSLAEVNETRIPAPDEDIKPGIS